MRIIKKPFLINIPLFSIVRIDHNKFTFPLLAIVWRLGTHGANGKHQWCGGLTPFVLTAKHIAKHSNDWSKATVEENVHSRASNSTMDVYYNHKTQKAFLYMVRNLLKQLLYCHTTLTNQLNLA